MFASSFYFYCFTVSIFFFDMLMFLLEMLLLLKQTIKMTQFLKRSQDKINDKTYIN